MNRYWLVDYTEKTVKVYIINKDRKYVKPEFYRAGEKVPVYILKDLKIDLELVFNNKC